MKNDIKFFNFIWFYGKIKNKFNYLLLRFILKNRKMSNYHPDVAFLPAISKLPLNISTTKMRQ